MALVSRNGFSTPLVLCLLSWKNQGNSFKSAKSKLQNVLATHEENSFKSVKSKLQNVLEEKMSLVDCVTKLFQSFWWNVYCLTTNKWLEDIWLPIGFCSDPYY